MSGHSHWANIQHTKEKSSKQRGKIFTIIGKELVVAVKTGGADPNTNSKLRDIIAKARANNMPNENIQRSIKRASGDLNSENYENMTYEGYGIGGVAVIVNCLTDKKTRTAGDVRHIFDRYGGSMGTSGSVSFMFDLKGEIIIDRKLNFSEDQIMEWALEGQADDVITDEDVFEVVTNPTNFNTTKQFLESKGVSFVEAKIELVAKSCVDLTDENYITFLKMIDEFENNDDVVSVVHNCNLRETD